MTRAARPTGDELQRVSCAFLHARLAADQGVSAGAIHEKLNETGSDDDPQRQRDYEFDEREAGSLFCLAR